MKKQLLLIFMMINSIITLSQTVPDSTHEIEWNLLRNMIQQQSYYRATTNDDCTNATNLTVGAPCTNGTTATNSVEVGEAAAFPCNAIGGGGVTARSSWYRFNSGGLTELNLSITRPGVGTNCGYHISVYGPFASGGGCLPTAAQSIYCEFFLDLFDPAFHFQINSLTQNSDYLVQVMNEDCGGGNNRTIDYCLSVQPVPSNNIPGAPTLIDQCGVVFNGTNIGYSPTNGLPGNENLDNNVTTTCLTCVTISDDVPYVVNNDSWFSFCSTNAGLWSIDFNNITNCVSGYGLQMTIFIGTPTNLTVIEHAPSPSAPGSSWTSSPFAAAAGDCIYLVVDGFAGDECDYSYTLNNLSGGCDILLSNDLILKTSVLGDNEDVKLEWSYESNNVDYFNIERSLDGVNFYYVNTIQQNITNQYEYIDGEPLSYVNYYRIKAYSSNNTTYSNMTVINLTKTNDILVYPQPVKDNLTINISELGVSNVNVRLLDILSKTAFNKNFFGVKDKLNINLDKLINGVYYMSIKDLDTNKLFFVKIKIDADKK